MSQADMELSNNGNGDIFITDSNEDAAIVCGVVSKCFGIRDDTAASAVFNAMDEKWPVVVY